MFFTKMISENYWEFFLRSVRGSLWKPRSACYSGNKRFDRIAERFRDLDLPTLQVELLRIF